MLESERPCHAGAEIDEIRRNMSRCCPRRRMLATAGSAVSSHERALHRTERAKIACQSWS
eukprot:15456338-Alexandrium_andersonii.AAC.1